MPKDFRLSQDLGIGIEYGRFGTVDGEEFVQQHVGLALVDVLAEQRYGRLNENTIEDVTTRLRRRLEAHAQIDEVRRIEFDRDAPRNVLRGEVVTDSVTVPIDRRL